MQFRAGQCFLYRLAEFEIAHLWVIAAEPNIEGQFAIVNFTSLRGNKDQTVVLRKGEHPFIKHDTCLNYSAAEISSVEILQARLECGEASMERDLEEQLLKLIQQGFAASNLTKNRIVDFAKKHC